MPRACRPRGTTISPPSALRSPPLPDHCCNAESPIHPCTALPSTLIALQDLDKIMLDYTEESVLKCFEHSAGELTTATGLAEIRDFFAGLFGLLTDSLSFNWSKRNHTCLLLILRVLMTYRKHGR